MKFLTTVFGDANTRYLKTLQGVVSRINAAEAGCTGLTDAELKSSVAGLKARVEHRLTELAPTLGELQSRLLSSVDETEKGIVRKELIQVRNIPLNEVLDQAFALVREAARRTLKQRHYDVQLLGGIALHYGQVAEMKTGEGKTLVATLPVFLNTLTGQGVHVITVNDYLAKRDATWMGQIYDALGLSVGIIIHDSAYRYDAAHTAAVNDATRDMEVSVESDFLRPVSRKEAYGADVTYGTNNEFGFDYLRDNMVYDLDRKVQRELHYAIVDEVDSILIDEARTPLIISAPDTRATERYFQFAKIVNALVDREDYSVDEKIKTAHLTEHGIEHVERLLNIQNLYVEEGIQTIHHIEQALKAQTLFFRDRDYTIKDGSVIIVDEFTGRLLPGRRYSEGLHQAIEAKEGVAVQQESRTMATITFQNYFRLYHKLAGMTGTAETEAEELAKIYNLDVSVIPTNREMIRRDLPDRIYKSQASKYAAVVDEIKRRHATGEPLLVGTISIDKNEYLGSLLEREGLKFSVLNAKHHELEAEIIAQAGTRGAITIATNMAGRGVDIKLGGVPFAEEKFLDVIHAGGLHIIGTERHEARRIDNQLRGRAGRQGDAGSTQFFISLDDDLMRIFGAQRASGLLKSWPDDMPIENRIISKSIETAQKKVEGHNFDIRKHLVEYDDVTNKQRLYIYTQRNRILSLALNKQDELITFAEQEAIAEIDALISSSNTSVDSELNALREQLILLLSLTADETPEIAQLLEVKPPAVDSMMSFASQRVRDKIAKLSSAVSRTTGESNPESPLARIVKMLYIRAVDLLWVEHLETIQYLRTGIGLRGYGQRDPVVEYKRESRDLFSQLLANIRKQFVYSLLAISVDGEQKISSGTVTDQPFQEIKASASQFSEKDEQKNTPVESKPRDELGKKIGRNDPCYCGSGKKYKKCHGA